MLRALQLDAHLYKLIFLQFVFAHSLKTFGFKLFCISRVRRKREEEDTTAQEFLFISFFFFAHFGCAHFLALRHLIYYGTIFIKAMGF